MVSLHRAIFLHPCEGLLENLCRSGVIRQCDAIVHPGSLAAHLDYTCAAKIGEVPGDLWLWLFENFDEVADADLLVRNQIQQSQSRGVRQRAKEYVEREARRCSWHARTISYMA